MSGAKLLVVVGLVAAALLGVGLIVFSLRRRRPRYCQGCKRAMLADWVACKFCGWQPGAHLRFLTGPQRGQISQIQGDVFTLGTMAGNNVCIQDPGMSKKHAGIRRDGVHYELADLGSTNGVYVNGVKVAKRRLAAGDIIRLGNTEVVFTLER